MPCSIKEPGLYDYVIFNDDLEDAFAQLVLVAKRALSGKQGNGSQSITGPVTLVAEEEPSQASQPAVSTAAAANATSAKVRQCPNMSISDTSLLCAHRTEVSTCKEQLSCTVLMSAVLTRRHFLRSDSACKVPTFSGA